VTVADVKRVRRLTQALGKSETTGQDEAVTSGSRGTHREGIKRNVIPIPTVEARESLHPCGSDSTAPHIRGEPAGYGDCGEHIRRWKQSCHGLCNTLGAAVLREVFMEDTNSCHAVFPNCSECAVGTMEGALVTIGRVRASRILASRLA